MKKLLLAVLATLSLCLTGCGNYNVGFGDFNFHYVHVQMYGMSTPIHLYVNTWKNDEGGIELKVKFNDKETSLLLGDGTYMMYDTSECPICGKVEYR